MSSEPEQTALRSGLSVREIEQLDDAYKTRDTDPTAFIETAAKCANAWKLQDARLLPDAVQPLFRVRMPNRLDAALEFYEKYVENWGSTELGYVRRGQEPPSWRPSFIPVHLSGGLLSDFGPTDASPAVKARRNTLASPEPGSLEDRAKQLRASIHDVTYSTTWILVLPTYLEGAQQNDLSIRNADIEEASRAAEVWLAGGEPSGMPMRVARPANLGTRLEAMVSAYTTLARFGFHDEAQAFAGRLAEQAEQYNAHWAALQKHGEAANVLASGTVYAGKDLGTVKVFEPTATSSHHHRVAEVQAEAHRAARGAVSRVSNEVTNADSAIQQGVITGQQAIATATRGRAFGPLSNNWLDLLYAKLHNNNADEKAARKSITDRQDRDANEDVMVLFNIAGWAALGNHHLMLLAIAEELISLREQCFDNERLDPNDPLKTGDGELRIILDGQRVHRTFNVFAVQDAFHALDAQRRLVQAMKPVFDAIDDEQTGSIVRQTLLASATSAVIGNDAGVDLAHGVVSLVNGASSLDETRSMLYSFVSAAAVTQAHPPLRPMLSELAAEIRELPNVRRLQSAEPKHPIFSGVLRSHGNDQQVFDVRPDDASAHVQTQGPARDM